jgi:ribosomal protein S18 acetylase RimI-like enzyme
MKIIQATINEIDSLAKLFDEYRVFYGKESDLEGAKKFLADRISNNESTAFIALDDNNNGMGFTHLYPIFSSTRMARLWLLNDLYVNQNYRKLGVGEALINEAKKLAMDTTSRGLILETANDNYPAQKLYEKTGWIKDNDHYYYSWEND